MPKIITMGTLKGGVGKTNSVVNISGILSEKYKVLVVDVDPQGNATNNLGIDSTKEHLKNIQNVFESNTPIEEVVVKSPVKELPNLDVIPSSIFLAGTETKIVSYAGRELILKNYFEDNKDYLSQYDYIVIDTNPSMSIINQNAFLVSDSIILLSDVSMNAVNGAEQFVALWGASRRRLRKEDNVKGLIVNNLDKRIGLSRDIIEYYNVHDDFKSLVFKTIIPMNVKVKEAELEAKPINIYAKESPSHVAYQSIVKEMVQRGII